MTDSADVPAVTMCDPESIVDFRRFDIPAKTMYARQRRNGIDCPFAGELYREHLRVWNGFSEGTPRKIGYEAYKTAFDGIIDDVSSGRFDYSRSPIPIAPSGQATNGGHRISAAWASGVQAGIVSTTTQPICEFSHDFFANYRIHEPCGLASLYADAMALEYCRLKKYAVHIALFWPSAEGRRQEAEATMRRHGDIFYKCTLPIGPEIASSFVAQVYAGEAWCKVEEHLQRKTELCFPHPGTVNIYLLDRTTEDGAALCKEELRDLYGMGKHSVHITDSPEETRKLAGLVFNGSSLAFLAKKRHGAAPANFERLLTAFTARCRAAGFDTDDICLSGSATLAAHGLRDVRDLDFLHAERLSPTAFSDHECTSHNNYIRTFGIIPEHVIYDPRRHYSLGGIKIITLDIWREVMKKRNEPKDQRDLEGMAAIDI